MPTGDAPPTAQDRYAILMRDHLTPALRGLGLRGSGGSFVINDANHWAIIGFQRSVHSDRRSISFTVNLTVASRAAWDVARGERPYLPRTPAPNRRYGTFVWQSRIGSLLPGGQDTWWTLDVSTDLPELADVVVAAIRDHALPAMHDHLDGGLARDP